jgi:hypothetical protein
MNNNFSLNRFTLLFNKQALEQYRAYLMSIAVLAGILTLLMGFVFYISGNKIPLRAQGPIFLNFLILSGTIFTSMIFADLGDKKKAIPLLILPVSHFEKYLVGWLYSFLIFLVVFTSVFYIIDFSYIGLGNLKNPVKGEILNIFSPEENIWIVFPVYAVLHSIFFLGAILFEKLHFIKTAFCFFIVLIVLTLLNYPLVKLMFNVDVESAIPFASLGVNLSRQFWQIQPTPTGSMIVMVTILVMAVILWVSAYFKLKEKEV